MRRRAYLATVGATLAVAGCTNSEGTPTDAPTTEPRVTQTSTERPAAEPTPDRRLEPTETPAIEQGPDPTEYDPAKIRARATPLDYDTIFRNIDEYRYRAVYYEYGLVTQTIYSDGVDQIHLSVSNNSREWEGDLFAAWFGDERLLEEDLIELWGVVEGLYEYETVRGDVRTVPLLTLVDYELLEE